MPLRIDLENDSLCCIEEYFAPHQYSVRDIFHTVGTRNLERILFGISFLNLELDLALQSAIQGDNLEAASRCGIVGEIQDDLYKLLIWNRWRE